ncbi:hypothetical protein NX059_010011 [Plenodomus lindquistii]|nr:hypothetical protein NX059_010011 [Plenodomus lindquistii]
MALQTWLNPVRALVRALEQLSIREQTKLKMWALRHGNQPLKALTFEPSKIEFLNEDRNYDSFESDGEGHDSDTSSYVLHQVDIKNAWDSVYHNNEHLLFCGRNVNIDLSTLHPD